MVVEVFTPEDVYGSLWDSVKPMTGMRKCCQGVCLRLALVVSATAQMFPGCPWRKFAEETAKTSSDVIGYGMVSCAVMLMQTRCGKKCSLPFLDQLNAGMLV